MPKNPSIQEHRNSRSTKFDKAIDGLYGGEDRQEELIDIICQCFYEEQTTKKN